MRTGCSPRWIWPWLIAVALSSVAASVAWSLETPGGGAAPDEQAHVAVAQHVADHGSMPKLGEPGFGITFVAVRVHGRDFPKFPYQPYATHPPGAYALSAAWLAVAGDDDAAGGFRWSRTSQFLLAAALAVFAFLGARAMFPRHPATWVAVATIIASWPGLTFLFAYLNPDGLAAVAGAVTVWSWFRGANRGWAVPDLLLAALALVLVVLSKPTAWVLVPLTLVVFGITAAPTLRSWLARASTTLAALVALAGPWMYLQMRRYDGDLTGIFVQRDAVRASGASAIDGPSNGVSYFELLTDFSWVTTALRTFVLGIPTHHTTTFELLGLAVLGLASVIAAVLVIARRRRAVLRQPLHVLASVLILLLALIASVNAWRGDVVFQGQGRYLYPAIVPATAAGVMAATYLVQRWWAPLLLVGIAGTVAVEAVHSLRAAYPGSSAPALVTYAPTCAIVVLGIGALIALRRGGSECVA